MHQTLQRIRITKCISRIDQPTKEPVSGLGHSEATVPAALLREERPRSAAERVTRVRVRPLLADGLICRVFCRCSSAGGVAAAVLAAAAALSQKQQVRFLELAASATSTVHSTSKPYLAVVNAM